MEQSGPMRAKFTVVKLFKQQDLAQWATKHIAKQAPVMSDGMIGFKVFSKIGCRHTSMKTTQNAHAQNVIFRWVNTILGNVKRAIDGTYHAIRKPYINKYLALFQFRFNHCFNLSKMLSKTISLLVNTPPHPIKFGLA